MAALFSLSGKVALVTGSVQGLGLAIATGYAKHGAKVVINGHDAQKVADVVARLRTEEHLDVFSAVFDVSKSDDLRRGIADIEKDVGPIDILVNNAGIQLGHPFLDYPEDDLDRMLAVNVRAVFVASQAVAKHMKERQRGKIINICSVQSHMTGDMQTTYATTKGAVTMMTKGMCVELAKFNIQVNGIGPGYFETAMTAGLREKAESREWLCQHTPVERWGQPEELVGPAVFLASDASNFVNGHVLDVDGGFLAMV